MTPAHWPDIEVSVLPLATSHTLRAMQTAGWMIAKEGWQARRGTAADGATLLAGLAVAGLPRRHGSLLGVTGARLRPTPHAGTLFTVRTAGPAAGALWCVPRHQLPRFRRRVFQRGELPEARGQECLHVCWALDARWLRQCLAGCPCAWW